MSENLAAASTDQIKAAIPRLVERLAEARRETEVYAEIWRMWTPSESKDDPAFQEISRLYKASAGRADTAYCEIRTVLGR